MSKVLGDQYVVHTSGDMAGSWDNNELAYVIYVDHKSSTKMGLSFSTNMHSGKIEPYRDYHIGGFSIEEASRNMKAFANQVKEYIHG